MALKLRPGQFFGSVVEKAEIGNFILSETVYPQGFTAPRHSHENAYYCIVLRGSYDQSYGCRSRVCQPLTLECHPSGELHSARFPEAEVRSFNIELRSSWLAMLADFPVSLEESAAYQGGPPAWLALRLRQEYRERDALTPLALESLALEMVVHTSRRRIAPDRHCLTAWLARAKELLEATFSDSVTLSAVAAEAAVHPVHLASAFHRHYHCTIGEYVRRLRVEYACQALAGSDASLTGIAAAAGFADQSHFCKTFKRVTGMTPGQYRASLGPA
jgi:AraC family transcriptional regulator